MLGGQTSCKTSASPVPAFRYWNTCISSFGGFSKLGVITLLTLVSLHSGSISLSPSLLCLGLRPRAFPLACAFALPRSALFLVFSSSARPGERHLRSAPRAISRTGELRAETTVCPPRIESPAVPPKPGNTKPQPASKVKSEAPLLPALFVLCC